MKEQINKINLANGIKNFPSVCFEDQEINFYLSSLRANILNVMAFEPSFDVLVIGDDFGVVSYFLCSKVTSVTLVETDSTYSKQINSKNKNIVFTNSIPDKKFDVIIIFDNLLSGLRKHLEDDGLFYIVTNNSLSAAAFSGLLTSNRYDKGLSKKELDNYLKIEGFKSSYYYFPLPDYRFSSVIFSEDYLPKSEDVKNLNNGHLIDRDVLFEEDEFMKKVLASGNFVEFANSYIVEAK